MWSRKAEGREVEERRGEVERIERGREEKEEGAEESRRHRGEVVCGVLTTLPPRGEERRGDWTRVGRYTAMDTNGHGQTETRGW